MCNLLQVKELKLRTQNRKHLSSVKLLASLDRSFYIPKADLMTLEAIRPELVNVLTALPL